MVFLSVVTAATAAAAATDEAGDDNDDVNDGDDGGYRDHDQDEPGTGHSRRVYRRHHALQGPRTCNRPSRHACGSFGRQA